jgi:preprotein translocase subunit SecY
MSRWRASKRKASWGRRKITQWTRYMTVILGALQSIGIAFILTKGRHGAQSGHPLSSCMTVLTLTTGTAFIMWLGEQITDRGIGNGMSLLIFAGIVAGLPRGVGELIREGPDRRLGLNDHPRGPAGAAWRAWSRMVAFIVLRGAVWSGASPSRARGASSAGA